MFIVEKFAIYISVVKRLKREQKKRRFTKRGVSEEQDRAAAGDRPEDEGLPREHFQPEAILLQIPVREEELVGEPGEKQDGASIAEQLQPFLQDRERGAAEAEGEHREESEPGGGRVRGAQGPAGAEHGGAAGQAAFFPEVQAAEVLQAFFVRVRPAGNALIKGEGEPFEAEGEGKCLR